MWLFWPAPAPGNFKQGCSYVLVPMLAGATSTLTPLQKSMVLHAVCRALPGLHAFTGCDSTSAFVGRGKKTGLALISAASGGAARQAMTQLGTSLKVSNDLLDMCEQFACKLYGSKTHTSINELRYEMFCSKASQSFQLPPPQDALHKHILRANYQTAVWIHALVAKPDLPGPDGHGWYVADGQLKVDWMDQQPAPSELLEFVSCGCQTGCTSARCSCLRASLPCTDACHCKNCENGRTLDGIELGETEEFYNYPYNSDATESDEDEATST